MEHIIHFSIKMENYNQDMKPYFFHRIWRKKTSFHLILFFLNYRSKDWRDKHILIVHEGQKPYVCDACGKAFGMKQGLKEHYIIVHEKNGKLKCHQCNFTAPNNSRLRFHIQTVHEKKSLFECTQCTFTCYRKDGLKAHVDAVHEKKRPHKCDYCDGAFFLRRDKERHLLKFHNIDVKKGGLLITPSC